MTEIQKRLFELQDLTFRAFHAKLIPTVEKDTVIGVRTPQLRKLAKDLSKKGETEAFLETLPHTYFDENQVHAFVLAQGKNFSNVIKQVDAFLPYINNWATCDQLRPKVFKKHREELFLYIRRWIQSEHPYTIRFGIGMLMDHFLEEDFEVKYAELVAGIHSEEYYVNMMSAWYFATALAKQYETILPFLEEGKLDLWVHNKAIQKACESYRITAEQKVYLRTLKKKE